MVERHADRAVEVGDGILRLDGIRLAGHPLLAGITVDQPGRTRGVNGLAGKTTV